MSGDFKVMFYLCDHSIRSSGKFKQLKVYLQALPLALPLADASRPGSRMPKSFSSWLFQLTKNGFLCGRGKDGYERDQSSP